MHALHGILQEIPGKRQQPGRRKIRTGPEKVSGMRSVHRMGGTVVSMLRTSTKNKAKSKKAKTQAVAEQNQIKTI